ncbi:type I polyketide synthase, partial [Nocardia tenerifensis]
QPQEIAPIVDERNPLPVIPLPLSGRGRAAVRAQALRLADALSAADSVLDVGYSLATTRAALDDRAVVLASDASECDAALTALATGVTHPAVITGRATEGGVAMVFSGQGGQRLGMGRELYDTYPAYADAFDTTCAELDLHLPQPLRDIIFGTDQHLLHRTAYAQPALFAVQVALYRLWESWGITPTIVTGHSIGEITAAHIAGALTLPDAARLITLRGQLMQSLPEDGAMLAVDTTEHEARNYLREHQRTIDIAAVNNPKSIVLSGDKTALQTIAEQLSDHRTTWLRVSHAFHSPLMEPILDHYRAAINELTFTTPTIPLVSTLTGQLTDHTTLTNPQHWINHARNTVRFTDAITTIANHNPAVYLTIGPDAALTAHIPGVSCASLRHDRPETETITTALAHLVVNGVDPNWHNYFHGTNARKTDLPTYPFQRQHLWLDNQPSGVVDLGAAGLDTADHPILKASVTFPSSGRMLFSGRVSVRSQPWLADHVVHGAVLFPGAAFVDLVLHAGFRSGHPRLAELTIDVPLALTDTDGAQLRVEIDEAVNGRRGVAVFSRPEGAEPDEPWTRHCVGVLDAEPVVAPDPVTWPPADAEPVGVDDFYEGMSESGIVYGPAFRGLRAAWRRGDELFAMVRLDHDTGEFALHPALFDAALQVAAIDAHAEGGSDLPFSFADVALQAPARDELRVRLVRRGDHEVALDFAGADGKYVGSIAALVGRAVSDRPRATRVTALRLDWQPVALPHVAELPSDTTVLDAAVRPSPHGDVAESARLTAEHVLCSVQDWLARQGAAARLVVVTTGVGAADPALRLPAAAVWGLVRSVQIEHPGRVVLVDTDRGTETLAAAIASGEPQLRLSSGGALVPRLVRRAPSTEQPRFEPGTVLVTGASGALGGLIATHLVESYGVRKLLLVSRRGAAAPGADEFGARLRALGAEVDFAACDVGDRSALAKLVAAVPADAPLRAVVHCAGVVDDATTDGQSGERLRRVFAPKADAAWHLHELTRDLDLSAFVLFSSAAGVLGSAGQANYAAANAFLDGLAAARRAQGLAAVSMAWGLWDSEAGMTGALDAADRRRLARTGIVPIRVEQGLALFDAALTAEDALAVPLLLNRAALRDAVAIPAVLRGFAPAPETGRSAESPADRIRGLTGAERRVAVLELVHAEVAATLGHASTATIAAERSFADLGFDSLTATELRNRLTARTGVALPATVAFDHPSPTALATFLDGELPGAPDTLLTELDRLAARLAAEPPTDEHAHIAQRLTDLLDEWNRRGATNGHNGADLADTTPEELMDFIDRNL